MTTKRPLRTPSQSLKKRIKVDPPVERNSIAITNLQKRISLQPKILINIVQAILTHEKVSSAQLSFVFVSDARMKILNRKYHNADYPTDVLSFDFYESAVGPNVSKRFSSLKKNAGGLSGPQLNGEIIISTDTAVQNARAYETSTMDEIVLYMIHGILHLLGYDDHSPQDVRAIRRKEKELLTLIRNTELHINNGHPIYETGRRGGASTGRSITYTEASRR